jgi:hypothetical protein
VRESSFQANEIVVRHGELAVRTVRLEVPVGAVVSKVAVDGVDVPFASDGPRLAVSPKSERRLKAGDAIRIRVDFRL